MTLRDALYLINKRTKEIRDILRLYADIEMDRKDRKNFRILMRRLYVTQTHLEEVLNKLIKEKTWLYSLKYTLVTRDGKAVGVARKDIFGGMELYLLIEFEGIVFHIPATVKNINDAGFEVPHTATERIGSCSRAPETPISDSKLMEAVEVVKSALGNTPLLTPPCNAVFSDGISLAVKQSISEIKGLREGTITIRSLAEHRRAMASK